MVNTVTFPALDITFELDPVAFRIGDWSVYWYGILISLGFALAIVYCSIRSKGTGITREHLLDAVIIGAPVAVVCARLYYCAFHFSHYFAHPEEIFRIWDGGLAIYGGVIGAVITLLIFTKIKKISAGAFLDLLSMGLLIGQILGRWGNFFNAECFGRDIPAAADGSYPFYAMLLSNHPQAAVHPLFFYESMLNLLLFIALHFYFRRKKFNGEIFLLYLAGYGAIRFFTEGIRGNDALLLWNTDIRVSQLLSAVFAVFALAVLIFILIRRKTVKNDAALDAMFLSLSQDEEPAAQQTQQTETGHQNTEEGNL